MGYHSSPYACSSEIIIWWLVMKEKILPNIFARICTWKRRTKWLQFKNTSPIIAQNMRKLVLHARFSICLNNTKVCRHSVVFFFLYSLFFFILSKTANISILIDTYKWKFFPTKNSRKKSLEFDFNGKSISRIHWNEKPRKPFKKPLKSPQ